MRIKMKSSPINALPLLFLAASFAGAQAPSRLLPAADTSSNRISIDVEVTDKLGHPVPGLQAQDFTLLDNKQPGKILSVRSVDTRQGTPDPVHVIIVLDTINTRFEVVAREREELGEFLKQEGGRLAHPTTLAMLTEKGIQIEKASSTDGNLLAASLKGANPGFRMEGRSAGFYGATDRLQWSLGQLSELAAYEATQPGRKLALVISPGWPLLPYAGVDSTSKQRQWTFNAIVHLTNALRESHVALYTLDPFTLGGGNPFFYKSYLKGVPNADKAEYPDLGLQVFATHTGGTVQLSQMDIQGELNNAIRDAGSYYALTFEAPPSAHANEFHEIRLNLNQAALDKSGLTVRTTTEYYANVDTPKP
jgi:VWFA-related protein